MKDVPFTYAFTSDEDPGVNYYLDGILPQGLQLTGDTISGTPTNSGVFTVGFTAANEFGSTTLQLVLTVTKSGANVPPVLIAPANGGDNGLHVAQAGTITTS